MRREILRFGVVAGAVLSLAACGGAAGDDAARAERAAGTDTFPEEVREAIPPEGVPDYREDQAPVPMPTPGAVGADTAVAMPES